MLVVWCGKGGALRHLGYQVGRCNSCVPAGFVHNLSRGTNYRGTWRERLVHDGIGSNCNSATNCYSAKHYCPWCDINKVSELRRARLVFPNIDTGMDPAPASEPGLVIYNYCAVVRKGQPWSKNAWWNRHPQSLGFQRKSKPKDQVNHFSYDSFLELPVFHLPQYSLVMKLWASKSLGQRPAGQSVCLEVVPKKTVEVTPRFDPFMRHGFNFSYDGPGSVSAREKSSREVIHQCNLRVVLRDTRRKAATS